VSKDGELPGMTNRIGKEIAVMLFASMATVPEMFWRLGRARTPSLNGVVGDRDLRAGEGRKEQGRSDDEIGVVFQNHDAINVLQRPKV